MTDKTIPDLPQSFKNAFITGWPKRLLLANIPLWAFLLIESNFDISKIASSIARYPKDASIFISLGIVVIYVLLGGFQFIRNDLHWGHRHKFFKQFVFFSVLWAIAVCFVSLVFDPFDYRSMYFHEYIHMFSIALGVPVFAGMATYIYIKFVQ